MEIVLELQLILIFDNNCIFTYHRRCQENPWKTFSHGEFANTLPMFGLPLPVTKKCISILFLFV